jgi:hypothetical protein
MQIIGTVLIADLDSKQVFCRICRLIEIVHKRSQQRFARSTGDSTVGSISAPA